MHPIEAANYDFKRSSDTTNDNHSTQTLIQTKISPLTDITNRCNSNDVVNQTLETKDTAPASAPRARNTTNHVRTKDVCESIMSIGYSLSGDGDSKDGAIATVKLLLKYGGADSVGTGVNVAAEQEKYILNYGCILGHPDERHWREDDEHTEEDEEDDEDGGIDDDSDVANVDARGDKKYQDVFPQGLNHSFPPILLAIVKAAENETPNVDGKLLLELIESMVVDYKSDVNFCLQTMPPPPPSDAAGWRRYDPVPHRELLLKYNLKLSKWPVLYYLFQKMNAILPPLLLQQNTSTSAMQSPSDSKLMLSVEDEGRRYIDKIIRIVAMLVENDGYHQLDVEHVVAKVPITYSYRWSTYPAILLNLNMFNACYENDRKSLSTNTQTDTVDELVTIPILNLLWKHGANVNLTGMVDMVNEEYETLLHHAINKQRVRLVEHICSLQKQQDHTQVQLGYRFPNVQLDLSPYQALLKPDGDYVKEDEEDKKISMFPIYRSCFCCIEWDEEKRRMTSYQTKVKRQCKIVKQLVQVPALRELLVSCSCSTQSSANFRKVRRWRMNPLLLLVSTTEVELLKILLDVRYGNILPTAYILSCAIVAHCLESSSSQWKRARLHEMIQILLWKQASAPVLVNQLEVQLCCSVFESNVGDVHTDILNLKFYKGNKTHLHVAARDNNVEVMALLLFGTDCVRGIGIDVNSDLVDADDTDGITSNVDSTTMGWMEYQQHYLDRIDCLSLKDDNAKTPRDIAVENGHDKIVKMIDQWHFIKHNLDVKCYN